MHQYQIFISDTYSDAKFSVSAVTEYLSGITFPEICEIT